MKAISLWQPWASLWLSDCKIHETRHWPTRHRGWLAVHAAKRIDFDHGDALADILDSEFGPHWGLELPRGAVLGCVNLTDCVRTETICNALEDDDRESGNFAPGRWAWRRGEFRRLQTPMGYRGAQGLFDVPDELLAALFGGEIEPAQDPASRQGILL